MQAQGVFLYVLLELGCTLDERMAYVRSFTSYSWVWRDKICQLISQPIRLLRLHPYGLLSTQKHGFFFFQRWDTLAHYYGD